MKHTALALASLLTCSLAAGVGDLTVLASDGAVAPAQVPKGTGEISGVVLDAVTKRPVFDATVTLSLAGKFIPGSGLTGREVLDTVPPAFRTQRFYTQANGLFRFVPPTAGHYSLAVRKPGYATGYFGQQKPRDDMQFFDFGQDQVMKGVTLLVWPGASISGAVRSAAGVPLQGKWVQLFEVRNFNGVRSFMPVIEPVHQATDAAGAYRFTGLTNGRYLVRVSTTEPILGALEFLGLPENSTRLRPDASDATYPAGQLPSSRDFIDVALGQERKGIDFALPDGPLPTYQVSGRIEGAAFSLAGQKVRLVLADAANELPSYLEIAVAPIAEDGSFVLQHVPAGSYRIRSLLWPAFVSARHNPPGIGPPEQQIMLEQRRSVWIDRDLTLRDTNVDGLVIRATDGARVRGRIVLSPELQNLPLSEMWINARSLDGWNLQNLPVGRVEADGTFSSAALPPGRYSILPRGTGNVWFPESALLQTGDTIASGLEVGADDISGLVVTLTSAKARVSGTVTDSSGAPRGDAHVLFFRKGGSWQSGNVGVIGTELGYWRTSPAGAYELPLNAGDYFIVAVVGDFPEAWWDAAFLQSLIPRATTVSLRRGASIVEPLIAQVVR